MTLQDLNKKLDELSKQKNRESLLEFAYALTEWMGLETTNNRVPQLLAPKTQKLKDFLVPAPQTVQPQLYRLSTENQNIRVRFAVLKKIKKEYLSQLVDNDPGAESFQNTPDALRIITKAPYFVHFVATADYDRLILIFNHGDQKRIVSFRNRLTNTQYNKIILEWQNIANISKTEIAELLWKSLDIKEVNKEFYKQIKERFDALLGIVRTQHSEASDNQIKQFTVRLIGRYIFCWFLKEKGIISQNLIGKKTIEETENYYQSTLLKLFFETLNTKVQDRNPLTHEKLFEKIPYLNGGLFDESDEDKLFENLNLDTWLLPFVDILESYDFTVDESSSQYQQVAVDPEMLGRIFENLLASQNEETEKLANQRKAFGAFYTPREIVDYMVIESLRAFLQTNWEQFIIAEKTKHINNPEQVGDIFGKKLPQQLKLETKRYAIQDEEKIKIEKSLEPLFTNNPETNHLKKDEKSLLLGFLEQIKILDPACGSGAFPMGVLHKLVELNEALGTVKSVYELKKDILSQNIYGVDIMPMAIEIARLRAWLSLVLEEDYKPNDPKHNFGVKPLPNLDFKFVCANSLIDSGYDEFLKKLELSNGTPTLMRLDGEIQKLETIRDEYFDTRGVADRRQNLRNDFNDTKNHIKTDFTSLRRNWNLDEFFDKIDDWNPFDDSHASSFFSSSWMFGKKVRQGFDVVIGNPPYIQMQKDNGRLANQLKNEGYSTFERTGDVYAIFYELGFKVLKPNGVHVFITSSQWLKANYGKSLRKLFLSKNPIKLISLGPGMFETAVVDTNILIAKNAVNEMKLLGSIIDKPEQINNLNSLPFQSMSYVTLENWAILNDGNQSINEKIHLKGKPLKEWRININRGVLTGYNEAYIIDETKRKELIKADSKSAEIIKPILRGKEIEKYFTEWDGGYLVDTHNGVKSKKISRVDVEKYPAIKKYLDSYSDKIISRLDQGDTPYNLRNCAYLDEFTKEKIIWKRIGSQLRFSYSDKEIYCLDSTCIATGEKIKYLTALLNSKLCNYQLFESAPKTGMGDLIISVQALEPLLVYYPTDSEQKQIEKLLDRILEKKRNNQSTKALENEIDIIVYKLYDLNYEEVKLVDKNFGLNEKEYESYDATKVKV